MDLLSREADFGGEGAACALDRATRVAGQARSFSALAASQRRQDMLLSFGAQGIGRSLVPPRCTIHSGYFVCRFPPRPLRFLQLPFVLC